MATESLGQQWSWPDEDGHGTTTPPVLAAHAATATAPEPIPTEPVPTEPSGTRWKPRTCRICLEVVQPSTELDDTLAGRAFASKPRVRYVSEDPDLGRLMSPCNCKGSQKYVHEGCLQAWRNAAPMADRNFWRCPTCLFEYRMERLRWAAWLSSKLLRAAITFLVMIFAVFLLGFFADPIIGYGAYQMGSVIDAEWEDHEFDLPEELETSDWFGHFVKGFLSLGLLGFIKSTLAVSPFHIFFRGGDRRRRRGRPEDIGWVIIAIGLVTFLAGTWKAVSHFSAKVLEKISDRVMDVQGTEPEDDEEDENTEGD
ncbi:putative E3 ubiquitin-protein ligase, partial [Triangularia verruculosa]